MDSQTPPGPRPDLPNLSPEPVEPKPVVVTLSDKAAKLIASASNILFGLFAIIVAFDTLPPRLLDPLWQIGFAVSLTNTVSFPLVGLALVHIGAALAPLNADLNRRRMLVSRLAASAAAAYLMLIPLLGFAVWRGVTNIGRGAKQQEAEIVARTNRVLSEIDKASSAQQLQQSMLSARGPVIRDPELTQPLPELKAALRQIVGQVRQKLISEIPRPQSQAYIDLYMQALRAALIAALSSIGFAALSWNSFKESSLLDLLLAPKTATSLQSSPIQRLRRRLASRLSAYRIRQKLEASTAERKSFWSSIKNKDQRAAAKREKDLKRHAQKMLKMQRERERQLRRNKKKS